MSDGRTPPLDLSAKRRALLDRLLQTEDRSPGLEKGIGRRAGSGPAPVSFAQERLWFLDQLEPGSPLYNLPRAVRLRGPLALDRLGRAFGEIVARHEALRTTFGLLEGRPVQIVVPALPVPIPVVDLEVVPASRREARAMELATEEARRPFDLSRGPLLRIRVLRLGPEDHVLLLTLHHIVCDGWSSGILVRELLALMEAFEREEPSPLPELPIQYADFAVAQRRWMQEGAMEEQLAYWREQLAGAPPVVQLPTDRARPAAQSYRGAHRPVRVGGTLTGKLRALGRETGATPFMVLLAAFQTLVHRYTGLQDVPVGSLIANRNHKEVEPLIGFFANTVVLRTDLSRDPTFRELLGRVREVTLGAYANQDLPFERLVEALQPRRDPSYHPLFQVMLILQNTISESRGLHGISIGSLDPETGTSRFDLAMVLEDSGEELSGFIEYSTDLFEPATIDRLVGHWETLLEGIAANPDRRLSELPLMPERERRRVVIDWNATRAAPPDRECAHGLFEAQVERTPDAVALESVEATLTYRELNERANRLARFLISRGARLDDPVALCLERSATQVIAVLGILKAGSACLALDPTYPRERLAFMLRDSGARLLVTQGSLAGAVPSQPTEALVFEEVVNAIEALPSSNPDAGASADTLAYVIYTSGSTGRPKGIGMPHRSLANLVEWHRSAPSPCRRTLQFASLSFDVSYQEILAACSSGRAIVVIPESARLDARELGNFIAERGVDRLHLPNVVLQKLSEEFVDRSEELEGVLEIMVGGEQLQITPSLRRFFSRLRRCTLFNHYGPSESHVVTSHTMAEDVTSWPVLPPIGRPIANTRIYILDAGMRPAPTGVAGELFIGGTCLARGYLDRPDLTAERFLPDPFVEDPGARLYRTGDLARFLASGEIEFLGRADHQVKIRGLRIELGEIEAQLARHPAVREAVVIAREESAGDLRLVAYIIPESATAPDAGELRRHLRQELPEFMVPSLFVPREALPRTPNGKIDRAALPPPAREEGPVSVGDPPRTAVERALAGIWCEVLGIDQVGVNDGFFDLGGHSLLATQVLSRVRSHFRVEIALREFFESPTIAGLASVVERGGAPGTRPEETRIPGLARGGRRLEELLDQITAGEGEGLERPARTPSAEQGVESGTQDARPPDRSGGGAGSGQERNRPEREAP